MPKRTTTRRIWILTAVGRDQPGIVARVAKILFELGCNLEDSAMTRLGGEFAIMLLFSSPMKLDRQTLEQTFGPVARDLNLALQVRTLTAAEVRAKPSGRPYQISVYGADHAGIVFRISELLSRERVNITDVSTHRTSPAAGRGTKPLYLMLLEVELPRRLDASRFEERLRQLAKSLGVEVTVRSAEPVVL